MTTLKKSLVVIVSAIVLSTLGIQASDTLRGLDTNLTGLVGDSVGPGGEGAVKMLFGSQALCVDTYEASPGADCSHANPESQVETQNNINDSICATASQAEVIPWRFVSLTQAQQLCARTGKRLPTNEEWYKIAVGMADQSGCVVDNVSSPSKTGTAACVTPAGVHDLVGNVWEWIDEEVVEGSYRSRDLPAEGYVSLVDSDGVVLETSGQAADEYGDDYAWTKPIGVYGIIRGGYYGSKSDAGIFAQNLAVPLNFKTAGVGFRCVRDI